METLQAETQEIKEAAGFRALQKTCAGFGETFTKGTSAIADVILDRTVTKKKERIARVGAASLEFFKELASGLKRDLQKVSVTDVMAEAAYEAGKATSGVKKVSGKTWSLLMQKLDEEKS